MPLRTSSFSSSCSSSLFSKPTLKLFHFLFFFFLAQEDLEGDWTNLLCITVVRTNFVAGFVANNLAT